MIANDVHLMTFSALWWAQVTFELWSGMTTWRSIDASFLPAASGTERAAALLGGIIFSISDIALGKLTTPLPHQYHTVTTPSPNHYHTNTTPLLHHYHAITTPLPPHHHTNTTPSPNHWQTPIPQRYYTITTPLPHQYHTNTTPLPHHYHTIITLWEWFPKGRRKILYSRTRPTI